ncbi:MAG: hemolysin III family protein [Deltaproteobacteria bacterium]|nr:hemolysin III family protein [Deltaproteobacteria bacterium]
MAQAEVREQTRAEEFANGVTHLAGVGLAVAGLVLLVIGVVDLGPRAVVANAIFGACLVLTYLASSLYHLLPDDSPWKPLFNQLDHAAIFLLIAGSYMPFMLVTVGGGWGWSIFGVQWGLALLGVVSVVFSLDRYRVLKIIAYLGMGWILVIVIVPLVQRMSGPGLFWLLLGGTCYTLGVPFFLWRSRPYAHAVWHLFVLAGSISHFFAALFHLPPV